MKKILTAVVISVFTILALVVFACEGDDGNDDTKDKFIPGPENPIFTDRFTTDPAPFYDEDSGYLYIVTGEDNLPPNASPTEYFRMPGWHLYKTRDMKTFEYAVPLLKSEDFNSQQKNAAWAAQLIKANGAYYFYVTVNYRIYVATAYNVEGPYNPITQPLITQTEGAVENLPAGDTNRNIDPTVFIDDDGQAYIVWCQMNPRVAKLNSDVTSEKYMVEIVKTGTDKPKLLFQQGWKMADPEHQYEEGPWIYKRNGKYYLFFASGHKSQVPGAQDGIIAENISYAMLESGTFFDGVWTDGVVISEYAPGVNWQGNSHTIHPGVIDFKGQTYMFYHSQVLQLDKEGNGVMWTGRNVHVDYMYFDEDGKPRFLDGVRKKEGISVPPKEF